MFAAVVVAALMAHTAFAADCVRGYTVQSGDTCNSIAAANSASTFQIMAVNAGTIDALCHNLMPEQLICLGTEGSDCTETHVVGDGDSCASVEATFGLEAGLLRTNNPNIDDECHNVYPGLVLCVATQPTVPTVPAHFFDYESLATSSEPRPNYIYQPEDTLRVVDGGSNHVVDEYEVVDSSDIQDGESLPYCDEVGYYY